MNILFIGDVHVKFNEYAKIVKDNYDSYDMIIQVGDFGLGFHERMDASIQEFQAKYPKATFIRGNHDNPRVCRETPGFIKDGRSSAGLMFIGGAWSIDWAIRTPGLNWWDDEECSIDDLNRFIDKYEEFKPKIMITHTCPTSIAKQLFVDRGNAMGKKMNKTRTEQAFERMFEIHKPNHWIFGHWHQTVHETIDGTTFHCLEELDTMSLDVDVMQL